MKFPRVPQFSDRGANAFFADLFRVLDKEFLKRTPDDTVRRSLFLMSPDKSVWEITIDDTGLIQTTKVSG